MRDFCVALALPLPVGVGNLSRETAIAFVRSYVSGVETAIAFAGEKWAFLVQLSGAEVLSVSTVAVQGRAVVLSVSFGPQLSVGFGVCGGRARAWCGGGCRCATDFALLGPVRTRARLISPSARKMAHNGRSQACWANFVAEIIGGTLSRRWRC